MVCFFSKSVFHFLRFPGSDLIYHPTKARLALKLDESSKLDQNISLQVISIFNDGDCTASLDNLVQCLTSLSDLLPHYTSVTVLYYYSSVKALRAKRALLSLFSQLQAQGRDFWWIIFNLEIYLLHLLFTCIYEELQISWVKLPSMLVSDRTGPRSDLCGAITTVILPHHVVWPHPVHAPVTTATKH